MIQSLAYDRPREKLNKRGVSALSLSELLQIIIGSGTAKYPVAKLARKVSDMLEHGLEISLANLLLIPGLGEVKASQILAVIELSKRLPTIGLQAKSHKDVTIRYGPLFDGLSLLRKQAVQCASLNGSGELIKSHIYKLAPSDHYNKVVKQIFADALRDGAASVVVGVGYRNQLEKLTVFELGLVKSSLEVSKSLNMHITAVVLVGKDKIVDITHTVG